MCESASWTCKDSLYRILKNSSRWDRNLRRHREGVSGRKSTSVVRKSEAELYIKMTIGRDCGLSNIVITSVTVTFFS